MDNYNDEENNQNNEAQDEINRTDSRPVAIFVGGWGDGGPSGIVSSYSDVFSKLHPEMNVKYFDWDERSPMEDYIHSLDANIPVSLIGHSYGGDTAAQVASHMPGRLHLLVTADPVGHKSNEYLHDVAKGANAWVNVNATGGGFFNRSNLVAGFGRDYGAQPRGIATSFINAGVPHEDFAGMMNAVGPGARSPEQVLTGWTPDDSMPSEQ